MQTIFRSLDRIIVTAGSVTMQFTEGPASTEISLPARHAFRLGTSKTPISDVSPDPVPRRGAWELERLGIRFEDMPFAHIISDGISVFVSVGCLNQIARDLQTIFTERAVRNADDLRRANGVWGHPGLNPILQGPIVFLAPQPAPDHRAGPV